MAEPESRRSPGKLMWADDDLHLPPWPGWRSPLAPGESPRRMQADPERVERGMAQLVLTVVELLRQLMERQALRRVERGSLTEEQEEQLGTALMRLAETMDDLKAHFELTDEDLNLHLGPLGSLL
jgi:Gas vesicle protein K